MATIKVKNITENTTENSTKNRDVKETYRHVLPIW